METVLPQSIPKDTLTAPWPEQLRPMLASTLEQSLWATYLQKPDWICEPKWDGERIIMKVRDKVVNVYSRGGKSRYQKYQKHKNFTPIEEALIFPTTSS